MVDVNDPSGYEGKYKNAREKLERADIDEGDRRAIRAFMDKRDASGRFKVSTQGTLLHQLVRLAVLAPAPLHTFEESRFESDYANFINGLRDGTIDGTPEGGYSESYMRGLRQSLRLYFEHLGKEWHEDIEIGQPNPGKITEDDCFTSDETARMFAAADERDSAILALMLATGQRITGLASIRLSDIQINGNRGGFYLNPKAVGLKGAEGYRPMIWATPYVNRWLNNHPYWPEQKDSDDHALFTTLRHGRHYDRGDNLGYSGYKKALKRLCKDAGIDGTKAKTHRLRHTAIRRMIRDGLSDQRIKYMVGWHEDSSHLNRYGSLSDKSHAEDIEEHYGMARDEEPDEVGHLFGNCPGCGITISELSGVQFCHSCGTPLKHSAENLDQMADQAMWDSKGKTETREQDDGLEAAKRVMDDPEAKAAVLNELKDELLAELKDETQ